MRGWADAAAGLVDGGLKISRVDDGKQPPLESVELDGFTATCQTTWPTDGELLRDWDDLSVSAAVGTPFHSPVWQEALCRPFAAVGSLRIVAVHRHKQLVAVIPLVLDGAGTIQSPGAAVSDYLDPLIATGCQRQALHAVLTLMGKLWDRRATQLVFHNVRQAVPARQDLISMAKAEGFIPEEFIVGYAPALQLSGSWDQFLAAMVPHERKEIRRKLNKAHAQGHARLVSCHDGKNQTRLALEAALAMMEACGGAKGDAVRKSIRPLLETTAPSLVGSGRMDILTLLIADAPAACLLQYSSATGPLLYNCGVDYAKKEWSPGVVAVAMAIEKAMAAGHSMYDLLRGQEPYKYRLGAVDRPLHKIVLRKSSG